MEENNHGLLARSRKQFRERQAYKMGLAASQARLLMLTARKDDLESQIMTVANRKLALSRQASTLSTEYAKNLYDKQLTFTGANNTSNPITYDMLMKYSAGMTDQYVITDAQNHVVLDNSLATALGISGKTSGTISDCCSEPQFLQNICGVTAPEATKYATGVPTTFSTSYKVSDVFSKLNSTYTYKAENDGNDALHDVNYSSNGSSQVAKFYWGFNTDNAAASLKTFLDGTLGNTATVLTGILQTSFGSDWDKVKTNISNAADAAKTLTESYYDSQVKNAGCLHLNGQGRDAPDTKLAVADTLGIFRTETGPTYSWYIDTSMAIKLFLYYFDQECNSIASTGTTTASLNAPVTTKTKPVEIYTTTTYSGKNGRESTTTTTTISASASTFADGTEDAIGGTTINGVKSTGCAYNGTVPADVQFYRNLYAAIKAHGWKIDNNVDDSEKLQSSILNGDIQVQKITDANTGALGGAVTTSSANSPMSEETVTSTQAEADYKAAKDRLDFKEQLLDRDMNDLDTERAAVSSEIESVNNILKKHFDDFKMFTA